MATVLLVIHLMISTALVGVVLLQKSEGGALGIGAVLRRRRRTPADNRVLAVHGLRPAMC